MLLRPKLQPPDLGFSLTEVLVAMLIATLFAALGMQIVVYAAFFRIRAQEFNDAAYWIQQDLDNRKYQANQLDLSSSAYTANTAACSSSATATTGYGDRLRDTIYGSDQTATSSTITTTQTSATTKKNYSMVLTLTPRNAAPYNVLALKYTVRPSSGGNVIATYQTEVVPDAAFQCP